MLKEKWGLGLWCRIQMVRLLLLLSSSLHTSVAPVVAESVAALHSVEFCHGRGFQKIVLEGDSLQLVSAIKNKSLLWATHGQVIADIQNLLRFFQSLELCYTKLFGKHDCSSISTGRTPSCTRTGMD
jgi:hypothetical protein